MFHRIEIEREDFNSWNKVTYVFWFNDGDLYLDKMLTCKRPSRKHKWRVDYVNSYSRINQKEYGIKEEPDVDIEVLADAVEKAREKIKFKKWAK